MSSVIRQFTVLSLFILAVRPDGELLDLKCQPTVGIVAQTTDIRCQYKTNGDTIINGVFLKKSTEENFIFQMYGNKIYGDKRFSLENPTNDPSLKISDTMFSDEGNYDYRVVTDRGEQTVQLSITVTAKYSAPVTGTLPVTLKNGRLADLYCNATDGFPGGFIHWFDKHKTNWTINSDLTKVPKDTNGRKSVALSSKLTFKSIDVDLAPFRCVVLNSKYEEDGESRILFDKSARSDEPKVLEPNTTKIIAGVMVIGSLIVGLLFALLFFRRKRSFHRDYDSAKTAEDDSEKP
ncbi:uncharacterized protein zgc:174863 isoform X2 [Danio aesculapii]|uniref:uncharacterized protein zgc:174863 isoform X2 n=1 Tax=Danio aesculapii TaxID=1142201 RepID=UPI0024BF52F9|nr:uncharacterized protein zgc:174863 isoform X2 [Danio aesculapii]